MKKLMLPLVVLVGAVAIGTGTAGAKEPGTPCENGNPTDLCGDNITVEVEPAGENCPNGGIKITVTPKAPEPVLETLVSPVVEEPPTPPEPEVFFICNGLDGEPGEPGEPGIPGTPGTPGGTIISPGDFPTVTQTTTVTVNINNGRGCKSVRSRVRLTLPQRMRGESTVRVKVDRERAISRDVVRSRFVRVNMRGKRCGAHLVQVRKRGLDPSLRLWTVTSPTGVNKKTLVP